MIQDISRLREFLLRHVRRGDGERGVALLSTILFMILLAGVSLVLLSTIVSQFNASYGATKSTKTVNASQAGLQVGLGVVRSIAAAPDVKGDIYGMTSKLPCDTLTGKVDGETADISYAVKIDYFLEDPTTRDASWRLNNKLTCAASTTGPKQAGVLTQPKYAVIFSEGKAPSRTGTSDAEGNRKIEAIYQFRVTNVNIPGGRIYNFDKTKCLEAEGKAANERIKFVNASQCTNEAKDDVQMWVYDTTYQIKLASSIVGAGDNLCITDPIDGYAKDARLQKCLTGTNRYTQLWSWTGDHSWRGQKNPISGGASNICLTSAESRLQVKNGCDGGFAPTAAVGASAAGKGTNQIVNYKEFGRCLDVTGENINADYMIAYPCKQDPTTGQTFLKWNHKWYYSEPPTGQTQLADQQIWVNDSGGAKKCLESSATGQWNNNPRFKACSSSNAAQKWTRYQKTADYASSYLFTDNQGRCLTANAADKLDGNWSKITVIACNGTPEQKWNAPATANDAVFGSYKEIHG